MYIEGGGGAQPAPDEAACVNGAAGVNGAASMDEHASSASYLYGCCQHLT